LNENVVEVAEEVDLLAVPDNYANQIPLEEHISVNPRHNLDPPWLGIPSVLHTASVQLFITHVISKEKQEKNRCVWTAGFYDWGYHSRDELEPPNTSEVMQIPIEGNLPIQTSLLFAIELSPNRFRPQNNFATSISPRPEQLLTICSLFLDGAIEIYASMIFIFRILYMTPATWRGLSTTTKAIARLD
jgi:hypothetical protein